MRSDKPGRVASVLAVFGVLLLVCSASYTLPPGRAATVWSDDFNDGNYTGWTVDEGTYSAVNYRLENTGEPLNTIRHASTVTTGTWSFDLDIVSPSTPHPTWVLIMSDDGINGYGVTFGRTRLMLQKTVNGGFWALATYYVGPNTGTVLRALEHVDVTRTTAGELNVWLNGTHRLYCQDITFSSSTYFVHGSEGDAAQYLDNVVVSDTIDLQPPTNTTTTTAPIPGFAVPAIALGLVVALATAIVYRRRKP